MAKFRYPIFSISVDVCRLNETAVSFTESNKVTTSNNVYHINKSHIKNNINTLITKIRVRENRSVASHFQF